MLKNKIIAVAVGVSMCLPMFASAQTSSVSTLIQQLQQQIAALQAQIAALKTVQTQVATEKQNVNASVKELKNLMQQGMSGDDVALLQTILASDPSIFPEGIINGVFGPKTSQALKKFQRMTGLTPTGNVGPQTLKELNKFLKKNPILVQTDASGNQTVCALTLNGNSTPQGWLRDLKRDRDDDDNRGRGKSGSSNSGKKGIVGRIPACTGGIPASILNLFGISSTTPYIPPTNPSNDTTAPSISSISSSVTHQSAVVSWITNENANSKVYFGTTTPLNITGAQTVSKSTFETGHSLSLMGLTAATQYYFVIETKDAKGNTATSSQNSFTTAASPDTAAPTITAISVSNVGTSTATFTWTTNEASNSKVYYSTVTPLVTATASTKGDAAMVTSHTVTVTGLTPNTTHYFKVESADASNNSSTGSETSFTTQALPVDATAPVISSLTKTPATTTASVAWTTNEAATTKVYYGTVSPLVLGSASNVLDATLTTSHEAALTGLTASTTYYMVVESKDAANNTATSSETSFVTTN